MEGSIKEFLEIHRHYKTTIKKTETEIAFKNDQLQKVFNQLAIYFDFNP